MYPPDIEKMDLDTAASDGKKTTMIVPRTPCVVITPPEQLERQTGGGGGQGGPARGAGRLRPPFRYQKSHSDGNVQAMVLIPGEFLKGQ